MVADTAERALSSLPNNLSLTITHRGFHAPGCTFDLEHESMQLLAAAHEKLNGEKPKPVALTATTDARFFRLDANMPVTCYGPHADNIHGVDESVSIASMTRVATVMAQFIVDWCGVEPLEATLQNTVCRHRTRLSEIDATTNSCNTARALGAHLPLRNLPPWHLTVAPSCVVCLLAVMCLAPLSWSAAALADDKPVSGGTLNMLVQPEPPTLMLGLNQLGPTQFVAGKIYQSLLTYGPDLEASSFACQVMDHLARRPDLYLRAAVRRQVA